MSSEVEYTALVRMKIPNPGHKPSSIRLAPGDVFSLDGNEGLDVDALLRQGAIRLHLPPKAPSGPVPKAQEVSDATPAR